jgi:hypothetical protein
VSLRLREEVQEMLRWGDGELILGRNDHSEPAATIRTSESRRVGKERETRRLRTDHLLTVCGS